MPECIECHSKKLEVLEGKITGDGQRVNDLWFRCKDCGKESPVFDKEVEDAKKILARQKRI